MNPPPSAPPCDHEHSDEIDGPTSVVMVESIQPSVMNPPHINARSPSGNHLVVPFPIPTRRHSRENQLWTGSQTSLHDEPGSITHSVVGSLRTNSSTTVHSLNAGTSPGNQRSRHSLSNINNDHQSFPHFRNSSQVSVAHTYNSRSSVGRASYREHHGSVARPRTPISGHPLRPPSSASLNRVPVDNVAVFEPVIAPPSANDPSRPGEPIDSQARFFPMSASSVLRYEDHRKTRSPLEQDHMIEAMMYQYPETPTVPEGWTALRHPEGALYYLHYESRTITEVDICNEDIRGDIEYFRKYLLSELEVEIKNRDLSLEIDKVQLVLEPKVDSLGVMCCYYFVNPEGRSLFWLDEWDGKEIFRDCKAVLTYPHKGKALVFKHNTGVPLYSSRTHWDLYPHLFKVTQELKDEILDMILYATCDCLTSNTSTCPLSPNELKDQLALVERIDPDKESNRAHPAVIIGRIMHTFYFAYFVNYYGEDCARLNFDQTVYGWRYYPSMFMAVFAPLLFMVPVTNVRLLHKISVDEIVSKEKWNMFITKLNSQLQETSVLATVLLNANVAFLSKLTGTLQLYLSYISLVASMASIVLGLVFMGNNRAEDRNTPVQTAKFLHRMRNERHGLETLAIIYSLPHAFLMWGLFLFFAAFAVEWCYPVGMTIRAYIITFILVVAVLLAWCTWTVRDISDLWWFRSDAGDPIREAETQPTLFFKLRKLFAPRLARSFTGESHGMERDGNSHYELRNSVSRPPSIRTAPRTN